MALVRTGFGVCVAAVSLVGRDFPGCGKSRIFATGSKQESHSRHERKRQPAGRDVPLCFQRETSAAGSSVAANAGDAVWIRKYKMHTGSSVAANAGDAVCILYLRILTDTGLRCLDSALLFECRWRS